MDSHQIKIWIRIRIRVNSRIWIRIKAMKIHNTDGQYLTYGIAGVELVGHVAVILPCHALANGGLHESRQRRQHVDRRIDLQEKQQRLEYTF
jgi:hypothetical protein